MSEQKKQAQVDRDRDRIVAAEIEAGRCPFGMLEEGKTIAHCPLGFPGCGCGDELMVNPYLRVGEEWVSMPERKEKDLDV